VALDRVVEATGALMAVATEEDQVSGLRPSVYMKVSDIFTQI